MNLLTWSVFSLSSLRVSYSTEFWDDTKLKKKESDDQSALKK